LIDIATKRRLAMLDVRRLASNALNEPGRCLPFAFHIDNAPRPADETIGDSLVGGLSDLDVTWLAL
jgi:hypothetical protein